MTSRILFVVPALWTLGGAASALAQTTRPLPTSSVTKLPVPKESPKMGEMVAKSKPVMALRNSGAPNILGVDDVISVSVIGHPEFSLSEAMVSSAGQISHPLGGLVKVSGLTLGQAALAIKKSLAVYMKKPVVTVGLVRAHVRQVSVTGAIKVPSIIPIGEGWRVTEAISAVGGLTKRPEMTSLSITRLGKPSRKLDLQAILDAPESSANIELVPGDYLRFDEQSVQVSIVGQVRNPGSVELSVGSRLTDAILAAGGTLPRAALSKATLRRSNGQVLPLNLLQTASLDASAGISAAPAGISAAPTGIAASKISDETASTGISAASPQVFAASPQVFAAKTSDQAAKTSDGAAKTSVGAAKTLVQTVSAAGKIVPVASVVESNPVLLTGDFISVPEQQSRITILGAVARPGAVDLPEGKTLRVTDALGAVGGVTIGARAARIGIARYTNSGRLILIDIDANALLVDNDMAQNAILHEDDLITVSALKARTIFVTGQVVRPGPVDADPSEGLTQLLVRAGGPTSGAALRRVAVTRHGAVVANVDMLAAVQGGAAPEVALEDGDYINVPRNEARVVVLPAVRNPGVYMIPEDRPLTIGDALALAGGPQVGAKLKEVVIFRETPKGTTSQLVSLEPKAGAPLPTSIVLQDKDFLYVPEGNRNRINPVQTGLQAFSAFSFLLR